VKLYVSFRFEIQMEIKQVYFQDKKGYNLTNNRVEAEKNDI